MTHIARNGDGLPRLVGYEQLRKIYGWGRRTIENAMRSGKLRRPMMIGKRAFWHAADIDDYLSRLRGDLEALAVDAPEKIPEEKLRNVLQIIGARIAGFKGQKIDPDRITGFTYRPTDDEFAAWLKGREEMLERFIEERRKAAPAATEERGDWRKAAVK